MPQVEVPAGIDPQRLRRRLESLVEVAHAEHRAAVQQWRRIASIQERMILFCRCAGIDPGEVDLEGSHQRLEELETRSDELREFLRTMKGPTTRHGRWTGTWGVD